MDLVESAGVDDHHGLFVVEGESDEVEARYDQFRLSFPEPKNATLPTRRRNDVETSFDVERDALGPPQSGIELFDLTAWRHPINRVEAGCRGSGNVEVVIEPECEVISGDARL